MELIILISSNIVKAFEMQSIVSPSLCKSKNALLRVSLRALKLKEKSHCHNRTNPIQLQSVTSEMSKAPLQQTHYCNTLTWQEQGDALRNVF